MARVTKIEQSQERRRQISISTSDLLNSSKLDGYKRVKGKPREVIFAQCPRCLKLGGRIHQHYKCSGSGSTSKEERLLEIQADKASAKLHQKAFLSSQFNRFIQILKYTVRQMPQARFVFYLQYFINKWNEHKTVTAQNERHLIVTYFSGSAVNCKLELSADAGH